MGDIFISIVPKKINYVNPAETASIILRWLIDEEIIEGEKTDCILSSELGFPPSKKFKKIIGEDVSDEFLENYKQLRTNGLEVITNKTVFDCGQNVINKVICPNCSGEIPETIWQSYISEWFENNRDIVKCVICQKEDIISNFDFQCEDESLKLSIGFSNLGFTFWNPPFSKFSPSFLSNMIQLLNSEIIISGGKV